jgi:hypothetical protein
MRRRPRPAAGRRPPFPATRPQVGAPAAAAGARLRLSRLAAARSGRLPFAASACWGNAPPRPPPGPPPSLARHMKARSRPPRRSRRPAPWRGAPSRRRRRPPVAGAPAQRAGCFVWAGGCEAGDPTSPTPPPHPPRPPPPPHAGGQVQRAAAAAAFPSCAHPSQPLPPNTLYSYHRPAPIRDPRRPPSSSDDLLAHPGGLRRGQPASGAFR